MVSYSLRADGLSITFFLDSMWHELRVVLHNRENTLLTQLVQSFAHEERDYAHSVAANWASLAQAVESMPFE
jgi:sorting nexin-8